MPAEPADMRAHAAAFDRADGKLRPRSCKFAFASHPGLIVSQSAVHGRFSTRIMQARCAPGGLEEAEPGAGAALIIKNG